MNEKFKVEANKKYNNIRNKIYQHIKGLNFEILKAYGKQISQISIESNQKKKKETEETKEGENIKENKEAKDINKEQNSKVDEIISKKSKFREFCEELSNNKNLYSSDLSALRKKCEEEKSSFEYYANTLLKEYPEECSEKYILENILLPFQIIDIDIDNIENIYIIKNIPDDFEFIPFKLNKYQETFLGTYLEIKKEIDYTKQRNYEKEILEILSDDQFINDLFSIFRSKNVSKYLKSKIKFEAKNKPLFIEDIHEDYDICLEKQFEQFMKDMKDDCRLFRKYIVIKQIAYKIPAMTNSSMRIFVNPIYEISKNIQNNEHQLKTVLKSALLVLFVHEITHFLKAYPIDNKYPKEYPVTPRESENGKCIIFYLFGTHVIKNIDYSQSLIIINADSWEDLNALRKLFEKSWNNNYVNNSSDVLDFYLTEEDSNTPYEKRTEYCLW